MNIDEPSSGAGVRRRQILDADLDAVAELLSHGFSLRPKAYWLRGLARQRDRSVPQDFPRYGYLLESEGRPVGALLMIYSVTEADGEPSIRCNLSSWYVEPAFRAHAPFLTSYALRDKSVTYVNVSPAPNTWPIIEAQGFRMFGQGKLLTFPALKRSSEQVRIVRVGEGVGSEDEPDLPERALLQDHARYGCLSLAVEADDGLHPFVFMRRSIVRRIVPTMQLVFCRDLAEFVRFASPLGRYLVRRGTPWVLVDANGPLDGLVTRTIQKTSRRYVRGPHAPRPGDLAYTEGVLYGP